MTVIRLIKWLKYFCCLLPHSVLFISGYYIRGQSIHWWKQPAYPERTICLESVWFFRQTVCTNIDYKPGCKHIKNNVLLLSSFYIDIKLNLERYIINNRDYWKHISISKGMFLHFNCLLSLLILLSHMLKAIQTMTNICNVPNGSVS